MINIEKSYDSHHNYNQHHPLKETMLGSEVFSTMKYLMHEKIVTVILFMTVKGRDEVPRINELLQKAN